MKKLLILRETNLYGELHVRGIFSTPQLAYDYINDYLNYLETDAKEFLGGTKLSMELLRLSIIRESLPRILKWNLSDKRPFYFFSEGLELELIECYESEEDLPKKNKKEERVIEF